VVLAPTSASAAYTTLDTFERATIQACRATVDGAPAVKFRVDNRRSTKPHNGGIGRVRDDERRVFEVKPAAGRLSAVRVVRTQAGDELDYFVGGANAGTGGELDRASLARC